MPRAGLSADAVVELALEVVDDGGPRGFETLTLTTVAARVGVAVPSLYKHVGGLPALRRAVAAACVDELTATIERALSETAGAAEARAGAEARTGTAARTGTEARADTVEGLPATGPAALRSVAVAIRTWALRRPGRYVATQGSSWTADADASEVRAAAARAVATLAGVCAGLDVPPERTVDAIRTVRAALHGFVMLELDGGFGMPDDVDVSFDFLLDTLGAALGTARTPAVT